MTIRRLDLTGLPPRLVQGGNLAFFLGHQPPLSTGCEGLDSLLGGGWPRWVVSYIQGDEASGKSSLCEETALRFLQADGYLALLACLEGDHPLPGFLDRLSPVQRDRLMLLHPHSLEGTFSAARDLIQQTWQEGQEYLLIVDDLPSLCQSDDPSSSVQWSINKVAPYLRSSLTVLLVNQVREAGFNSLVGATSYWRSFRISEVAVHLAAGEGLQSTGYLLKPQGLLGKTFPVHIRPGWGIIS